MTRHFDVDRLFEEWLSEGPSQLPDRTIDAIVRQLDDTPQRKHLRLPRRDDVNRLVLAFGGAAAVVVLAALALGLYVNPSGVGGAPPSPSPTASPSAARATLPPDEAPVDPGGYVFEQDGYRYTIDVPGDGWLSIGGPGGPGLKRGHETNDPPDFAALAVWDDPKVVYRDPCKWFGTELPTGRTPDDMAAALAELDAFSPSEPTDATLSGYRGKRVELTVPSDVDFAQCNRGEYRSYEGRSHHGPGQVDVLWILDVEGDRRVLVISYFPSTSEDVKAELQQMVESMQIEPAGP